MEHARQGGRAHSDEGSGTHKAKAGVSQRGDEQPVDVVPPRLMHERSLAASARRLRLEGPGRAALAEHVAAGGLAPPQRRRHWFRKALTKRDTETVPFLRKAPLFSTRKRPFPAVGLPEAGQGQSAGRRSGQTPHRRRSRWPRGPARPARYRARFRGPSCAALLGQPQTRVTRGQAGSGSATAGRSGSG